jgi:hypothetical protein
VQYVYVQELDELVVMLRGKFRARCVLKADEIDTNSFSCHILVSESTIRTYVISTHILIRFPRWDPKCVRHSFWPSACTIHAGRGDSLAS